MKLSSDLERDAQARDGKEGEERKEERRKGA
jgi:hypothetical protein